MKKTLQISSLSKQFGTLRAVDAVSFEAQKGDIIALLGPNGAGKSTLLNMVAGLIAPSCGEIWVCGQNIRSAPGKARESTGFLAEGAPLYGDMCVKDFLSYIFDLKGLKKSDKNIHLQTVAEMAQITNVMTSKIENLSKGYRRRVGFAQSILSDPPLLLLDEPTDGLDPNQKDHIRKLIKKMGRNKTVVISTHLLDDTEEMCNRILIMNHGKIIADGNSEDIIKAANTRSLAAAFRKLTGGANE